jgi:hypothetical protein
MCRSVPATFVRPVRKRVVQDVDRIVDQSSSHLGRRLKKLEVEMTDRRGLVPYSVAWRSYWLDWLRSS